MLRDKSEDLSSLTKWLYPEASKKHNAALKSVERAVGNASDIFYNKYKGDEMYTILGYNTGMVEKSQATLKDSAEPTYL